MTDQAPEVADANTAGQIFRIQRVYVKEMTELCEAPPE